MRSTFRIAFLALLAVLALGAVASASASAALPEIRPNPTKREPLKFTATSGRVFIESGVGATFECQRASLKGEFIGAKEMVSEGMTLESCTENHETLKTESLKGTLGYISKTAKTVGLRLEPSSGTLFLKGFYLKESTTTGELIGAISPVNKGVTSLTVGYAQEKGAQQLKDFEGGLPTEYLTWAFDGEGTPLGIEDTLTLKLAKEAKIEA
jgi:hypothetical protein